MKEPGLQPDFIEVHHARDGIGLVGLNGKIREGELPRPTREPALAPRLFISSINFISMPVPKSVPTNKRI